MPVVAEQVRFAYSRAYAECQEAYEAERERVQAVVAAPGVLANLRGALEVPDQDEFVQWLLSAVQVPDVSNVSSVSGVSEEFIDLVAEKVASKLQGSYAPPGLQTYAPPAPAPNYATPPPSVSSVPAGTLDMNRLTPLQRALVNAMIPQGR